jgi:anthranilate phosphoribosyltransferase
MKHAQPVRVALGIRTAFNLLGPLTNPAIADAQLAGAPSVQAAGLIAHALGALGLRRGFVAHGSDGLDEITTTGPTLVFSIVDGQVEQLTWTPEDFGAPRAAPEALKGGDAAANAEIARAVLSGCRDARRDVVLVNAAAALLAAGKAADLREGMERAAHSIDSGAAAGKVEALAKFTRG